MNLEQIEVEVAKDEEGAVVPIMRKNGEPYKSDIDGSESTITVVGSESKRYRNADDAAQRRRLRSRKSRLDPADFRREREEIAVACIIDWHGWESDGKALPCTPENVRKLLRYDHILAQVEGGIATHADFFANSSAS
jgi:hypothetical protein